MRVTYTMPGSGAVGTLLDGGGPVSEATGDSNGRAVTFASLPYPGETALFLPGVLAAAAGLPAPAGYPFYARADYPTAPQSEVVDPSGTYVLRAVNLQSSEQMGLQTLGSDNQLTLTVKVS